VQEFGWSKDIRATRKMIKRLTIAVVLLAFGEVALALAVYLA
jgi:hypothetical protein